MRRVLALRYGLDGTAPKTLEDVGPSSGSRASASASSKRALRELRTVAPGLELYLKT